MKILYLCYGLQSGVVKSLSQILRERNHEVVIDDIASPIRLPHINRFTLYLLGAAVWRYGLKCKQGYFRTKTAFEVLSKQAERLVTKTRPDMVLQSGCFFGLPAPEVPYILYLDHTHAITQARSPWPGLVVPPRTSTAWMARERATYHRADRILVMSDFVRASLVNDYGITESKIKVVGAGPVLPVLPDLEKHEDDGRTILIVGRNWRGKGGDVLLDAMDRVRQVLPEAHLLVVGVNRPYDEHVTYAGWVPSADISAYYKRATIFALPTLREAFGLVFLEAMAHSLPCIGTNIEAIPEIIVDGETGFIVPIGNDELLAERLVQLLKDPELRRRMGNAGRARQERLFTWQKVADAVEAAFDAASSD